MKTRSSILSRWSGRVAAGSPILAQEHIEKNYQLDPALFTDKPDYLLKVRGLSMRDIGILEGDLIAVKKTEKAQGWPGLSWHVWATM